MCSLTSSVKSPWMFPPNKRKRAPFSASISTSLLVKAKTICEKKNLIKFYNKKVISENVLRSQLPFWIIHLIRGSVFSLLVTGRWHSNSENIIFKLIIQNIIYGNALRWMLQNLINGKSTLVQVMAWRHEATSHYLNQCWPRSMMPFSVLHIMSLTMTLIAKNLGIKHVNKQVCNHQTSL